MPVHRPRPPVATQVHDRRREEIRARAFDPIRLNHGTPYPCTREDILAAITPNPRPRRSTEYVTPNAASYEIWLNNARGRNLNNHEYRAIIRLENFMRDFYSGRVRWGPDLIIKAFCDLDRVFFMGLLRGHVYVKWKTAASFDPPTRHRVIYGRTDHLGGGKARIYLNADAIFGPYCGLNPFKETWRTMLHEMCHAYEFTQVAERNWVNTDRHGRHFGTKILAVHARAIREIHVGAIHEGIDRFTSYAFDR